MILEKTRSRSFIERPPKTHFSKKPKKRLNNRRKFKAQNEKCRRKFTDYQVTIRAEISRQARLNDRSQAEVAFEEILRNLGVHFEKEKVILNGDRFVMLDFFLPERNICFEVDGMSHKRQEKYDIGRTAWLEEKGIKTIRFSNSDVLRKPEKVEAKIREMIDVISSLPSPK